MKNKPKKPTNKTPKTDYKFFFLVSLAINAILIITVIAGSLFFFTNKSSTLIISRGLENLCSDEYRASISDDDKYETWLIQVDVVCGSNENAIFASQCGNYLYFRSLNLSIGVDGACDRFLKYLK